MEITQELYEQEVNFGTEVHRTLHTYRYIVYILFVYSTTTDMAIVWTFEVISDKFNVLYKSCAEVQSCTKLKEQ